MPESPEADARPRVLVVEDDPNMIYLLERMLHSTHAVEVATEARAALDRMAKVTFDALVLNVNLGGSQRGVNVLRVARTLPAYGRAVAVALIPGGASEAHFVEAGFTRCVSKPFTKEKMLAALKQTEKGAAK